MREVKMRRWLRTQFVMREDIHEHSNQADKDGFSLAAMMTGAAVLELLRSVPKSAVAMGMALGVSPSTIHRAVRFLRSVGAPLEHSSSRASYSLRDKTWCLPLYELTPRGFVVVELDDDIDSAGAGVLRRRAAARR